MGRLALRDLGILVLTAALWVADAALRGGSGGTAFLVAMGAAVLTALCSYLVHEWGHLAGALAARSVIHLPSRLASTFLFRFDTDRNDRRQFLAMSVGGLLASALVLAAMFLWLPLDAWSGRVALALGAIGVLATLVLEVPVAWQVAHGAPLPRGAAYVSSTVTSAATAASAD